METAPRTVVPDPERCSEETAPAPLPRVRTLARLPRQLRGYRCRSLHHRDRDRAQQWAREQVAKLMAGDASGFRSEKLGQNLGEQRKKT